MECLREAGLVRLLRGMFLRRGVGGKGRVRGCEEMELEGTDLGKVYITGTAHLAFRYCQDMASLLGFVS
jgi:hypothetical protein